HQVNAMRIISIGCMFNIHTYIHTYQHTYIHIYIHTYIRSKSPLSFDQSSIGSVFNDDDSKIGEKQRGFVVCFVCMYVCMYVCMCMYVCVCMYVCNVCMYVCISSLSLSSF